MIFITLAHTTGISIAKAVRTLIDHGTKTFRNMRYNQGKSFAAESVVCLFSSASKVMVVMMLNGGESCTRKYSLRFELRPLGFLKV